MPEVRLFIATTIDGFIARENGSLDWLNDIANTESETSNSGNHDGGYSEFLADIDVVIMGRKTYDEILGFGVEWPYSNFKTYIVTTDLKYTIKTDNTFIINNLDKKIIKDIKLVSEKNIWLVGGGQLITQFINFDLIDEMTLNVISIIIGKGIRLFPDDPEETRFELVKTKSYGLRMVNLTYRRGNN